jgi:hypothetical protein
MGFAGSDSRLLVLIRLGLFLVVLMLVCIQLMLYIKLADEVDRKSSAGKGPFSSIFGLGRQNVSRIMRQHRAMYPQSNLRKKVWYSQAAVTLSLVIFLWSLR